MNAGSYDIKDMLVAETGLGLVYATNLFIALEPISPDNSVTIFDVPGRPPATTLTKGEEYYYDSINIRVRNKVHSTGMTLAYSIMNALQGRNHEVWNGIMYTVIRCKTIPALLGWDDNRRAIITINFEIQRRNA